MIIIFKILIISIFCNGVRIAMDENMILRPIYKWSDLNLPMFMKKPFTHCIYCFASTWGSLAYWLQPNGTIFEWAICCVCAIWANGLIHNLHE